MYIGDYLGRRAIYSPDRTAIVDTGKTPEIRISFAEMNRRANSLANWLNDIGVNKGDHIAVIAANGIEHLDLFFACSKLGAVYVALSWRLSWYELHNILSSKIPYVLVYDDEIKEKVVKSIYGLLISYLVHLDGNGIENSIQFGDLLNRKSDKECICETVVEEDIAAIVFTGGTTGLPKGVQISHRQIAWNSLNTIIHDIQHDDVYLNVFPMFHIGGLFVYTLPQVLMGGLTILVKRFNPELVLQLIERERVTVFAAVPSMYQILVQTLLWEIADLSSLRSCISGGAQLPLSTIELYKNDKGIQFKQGFGMTEFGPSLFMLTAEDTICKAGSVGRPNFYVDARVIDNNNYVLPPGRVGELILKGPSISSGYLSNNANAWSSLIDNDGWFHTGDLAYHDEEWYFYILGRIGDMFISGGENIYPEEVEAVLYRHPAVLECAVIGVPDQKWGEVGKAFVVLKPGSNIGSNNILAYLNEYLARYKIPKYVEFIDTLPFSSTGKVLRRVLKEESNLY
jgi:fatty-acyl-CoA synthase